MGFSLKTTVLVLVIGVVPVGAVSLHRLQPQAHRICYYKNWASPCHTSGWHADWTDITAFGVVLIAAIAAGVIRGNWKRKPSAARRLRRWVSR